MQAAREQYASPLDTQFAHTNCMQHACETHATGIQGAYNMRTVRNMRARCRQHSINRHTRSMRDACNMHTRHIQNAQKTFNTHIARKTHKLRNKRATCVQEAHMTHATCIQHAYHLRMNCVRATNTQNSENANNVRGNRM